MVEEDRPDRVRRYFTTGLIDAEVSDVAFMSIPDWKAIKDENCFLSRPLCYEAGISSPFMWEQEFMVLCSPERAAMFVSHLPVALFYGYLDGWLWRIWKEIELWDEICNDVPQDIESSLDKLMYEHAMASMSIMNDVQLYNYDKR